VNVKVGVWVAVGMGVGVTVSVGVGVAVAVGVAVGVTVVVGVGVGVAVCGTGVGEAAVALADIWVMTTSTGLMGVRLGINVGMMMSGWQPDSQRQAAARLNPMESLRVNGFMVDSLR
jgi:hypothetical protein